MRFLWLLSVLVAGLSHAAEPDLLEPDKAFRLSARLVASNAIEVRYDIAPGYYMYRDKFSFALEPAALKLGAVQLPPGVMKQDEFFGTVETYRDQVSIALPFEPGADTVSRIMLTAVSQGCADVGVCYPPQEQKARLDLAAFDAVRAGAMEFVVLEGSAQAGRADAGGAGLFAPAAGAGSEERRVAGLFRGGLGLLVASFFGFGLLLAFTPCMLPMLPVLSGIIVGRGHHLTKTHGFLLSLAYVLGMAMTYALAGVAAGLSGAMLSATLQNPWVLGGFAAVFVLLALSMFGLYELQLPAALQTRLTEASNRLHGGHFAGVFAMGVLSAVIIGPCVAAPLAGALLYVSQTRDVVLGGAALFAMALGMGVPLLAVGASAGALLPKAGPWMESVNRFFGVLLLGVAIYLISPLVPAAMQMLAQVLQ